MSRENDVEDMINQCVDRDWLKDLKNQIDERLEWTRVIRITVTSDVFLELKDGDDAVRAATKEVRRRLQKGEDDKFEFQNWEALGESDGSGSIDEQDQPKDQHCEYCSTEITGDEHTHWNVFYRGNVDYLVCLNCSNKYSQDYLEKEIDKRRTR